VCLCIFGLVPVLLRLSTEEAVSHYSNHLLPMQTSASAITGALSEVKTPSAQVTTVVSSQTLKVDRRSTRASTTAALAAAVAESAGTDGNRGPILEATGRSNTEPLQKRTRVKVGSDVHRAADSNVESDNKEGSRRGRRGRKPKVVVDAEGQNAKSSIAVDSEPKVTGLTTAAPAVVPSALLSRRYVLEQEMLPEKSLVFM
jgi:hypothetical protein